MSKTLGIDRAVRPVLPRHKSPGEAALYLWDYFYLSRVPTENEKRLWRRIECATIRIQESEPYMRDKFPAPVRFANARRVRRAAGEIARRLPQLESILEPWVSDTVEYFSALAQYVIAGTRDQALEGSLH